MGLEITKKDLENFVSNKKAFIKHRLDNFIKLPYVNNQEQAKEMTVLIEDLKEKIIELIDEDTFVDLKLNQMKSFLDLLNSSYEDRKGSQGVQSIYRKINEEFSKNEFKIFEQIMKNALELNEDIVYDVSDKHMLNFIKNNSILLSSLDNANSLDIELVDNASLFSKNIFKVMNLEKRGQLPNDYIYQIIYATKDSQSFLEFFNEFIYSEALEPDIMRLVKLNINDKIVDDFINADFNKKIDFIEKFQLGTKENSSTIFLNSIRNSLKTNGNEEEFLSKLEKELLDNINVESNLSLEHLNILILTLADTEKNINSSYIKSLNIFDKIAQTLVVNEDNVDEIKDVLERLERETSYKTSLLLDNYQGLISFYKETIKTNLFLFECENVKKELETESLERVLNVSDKTVSILRTIAFDRKKFLLLNSDLFLKNNEIVFQLDLENEQNLVVNCNQSDFTPFSFNMLSEVSTNQNLIIKSDSINFRIQIEGENLNNLKLEDVLSSFKELLENDRRLAEEAQIRGHYLKEEEKSSIDKMERFLSLKTKFEANDSLKTGLVKKKI